MRRAAFRPAAPPWITTRVSLVARMLIGISPLACPVGLIRLPLQRHVDDVGERGMAVEDVDVEPFVAERSHRFEPFLLARPAAAHPDLHAVEPVLGLGLAEPCDDAAERLLTSVKLAMAPPTMMFLIAGSEQTFSVRTSTAQS